jgi:hypothetical protein
MSEFGARIFTLNIAGLRSQDLSLVNYDEMTLLLSVIHMSYVPIMRGQVPS